MSYLKIYQKDLSVILGVASLLPVACFVAGFYTGSANQTQSPVNETVSVLPPVELKTDDSSLTEAGQQHTHRYKNVSTDEMNPHSIRLMDHDGKVSEVVDYKDAGHGVEDATQVESLESQYLVSADNRYNKVSNDSANKIAVSETASQNIVPLHGFNAFLVQAGHFFTYKNAVKFQAELAQQSLLSQITLDERAGRQEFLIIVDSFASKDEAKRYCLDAEVRYKLDLYVKARELDLQNSSGSFASL
ncbi:MAG: hypothetical protein P8103_07335 [Candidatus Thiodiazotropha sp.]